MEKVKLTKGQAEAIEDIKGTMHLNLEANLREQIKKEWYGYPFGSLNKLTTKEFLDALYIGYEVEERFVLGDWVVHENVGSGVRDIITKITRVENKDKLYGMWTYIDDGEPLAHRETHSIAEKCRHATPEEIAEEKQRRWWAKHGREVWELRKGDVIKKLCSPFEFEAWEITDIDDHYIYAKDSRMIHPKTTKMDANYKVICFAEDRKDVK